MNLLKLWTNPYKIYNFLATKGVYCKFLSDKSYLQKRYRAHFGKKLNLVDPQTFNAKLQWLKLYDRKPIYTTMVDKYAVKEYVAAQIGEEYIIPTLGLWERFDDIDFDALPDQFVLKCTHDSGGLVICRDKSKFDRAAAKAKIEKFLKREFYWMHREWPYKNVKPRIIAEQYISDNDEGELSDYKIHCFNGVPKFILVCQDRFKTSGLTEDFYSVTWERLEVKRPARPNARISIKRPENLEEMLELSQKLAVNMPFARIDFYIVNGKVYWGEITFYPASGFSAFEPEEWDYTFGSWIQLPEKTI